MRKNRIIVFVVLMIAVIAAASYYAAHRPLAIGMPLRADAAPRPVTDIALQPARPTPVARRAHKTVAMSHSSPSMAPTLNGIIADLKARADENDPAAASQLYNDIARCLRTKELEQYLPGIISLLDRDTSKDSADTLKRRDTMLENMQKELDYVQRNQPFCAGVDDTTLLQYVPSELKAAQLGDLKAARCYLGGSLNQTPGLLDHPEWLTDFKQNAMSLAEQGIERGDWGIAGLLGHAYGGFFSSSFLTQLTGNDAAKAYQYLKLQRLGAQDDFATKLDKQLAGAAENLTPDQIAQADAWAQQTYTRYFDGSTSNELSNGVNICDGGYDD